MQNRYHCLVVDLMHESLLPMLSQASIEADYRPDIKRDEFEQIADKYEIMVVRSKFFFDEELLSYCKRLKILCRAGAGVDNIDVNAAEKKNIIILNAPEGNRDAVAEHTVGMILTLFNKLHKADAEVRKKIWDREGNRGYELKSKTVAIIGYGYMGSAVAERLSGFGCRVIGYDKYKTQYSNSFITECNMQQIFAEADIVSLHVPLTEETRFMINKNWINSFEKNIWLINTSRGEILLLRDLVESLKQGKIKGVALDVLENEKLNTMTQQQSEAFEYLKNCDNVLFSPHVAGWTHESYVRINEVLIDKLKKTLSH